MSDSILQVNQIKDKGGNATGITIADSSANVTIGNLAAGTIGSNVTITDGANPHGWEHIKTISYSVGIVATEVFPNTSTLIGMILLGIDLS